MTPDDTRRHAIQTYFERLTAGDTEGILALFAPDARVHSPFLGDRPVRAFFEKLADASVQSTLTVFDVLLGEGTGAGQFRYDWVLKDGSTLSFEGVDHFAFDAEGRFTAMRIYYDTHPVREQVGDKYA